MEGDGVVVVNYGRDDRLGRRGWLYINAGRQARAKVNRGVLIN